MNIYVGIDPGKDGGIVILFPDNSVEKFTIPLIGGFVDEKSLSDIFRNIKIFEEEHNVKAILEDVHSIFGTSAKSNYSFGDINGFLRGMLVAYKIPFVKVQPKEWQREMFKGVPEKRKPSKLDRNGKERKGSIDTKSMAALAVQRLFPEIDLRKSERSKKQHDGLVDALLMAEYCRRKF